MSTETLTSLAMLKVRMDHKGDYLDYLKPFVMQVLVDDKPDPVTNEAVRNSILKQFGLVIPDGTIQTVLKRLVKEYPIEIDSRVYRIMGDLPDPKIGDKKKNAEEHINAVVSGLKEFSSSTGKPIRKTSDAVEAICAFLSKFNILCLRAYIQETAIPKLGGEHNTDIVLVSKYVLHLQKNDPSGFKGFMEMVQGHMIANALLCPSLQTAPKVYKKVTFYLDAPLLVHLIGAEGEPKKSAISKLIALLHKLKGRTAVFSHSRRELDQILDGAAAHIDDAENARGGIVKEARRSRTTKSDLVLLKGQVDDKLAAAGVSVEATPPYIGAFQIDEVEFEGILDEEISHYHNPRAKEYDINSLRSIYVLRKNFSPSSLEKCRAIFVTGNSKFAQAAWKYGKEHELAKEVSGVITNFTLANLAWLKAPMDAPDIPSTEIFAYSYAALRPSKDLLKKYVEEMEKLEKQGQITDRNLQLLRSSPRASDELMNLTLGSDGALTGETVMEMLKRIENEILEEEREKLIQEKDGHQETLNKLESAKQETQQIKENLRRRCARKAKICARVVTGLTGLLIAAVVFLSIYSGWDTLGGFFTLVGIFWGINLKSTHPKIQKHFFTRCLKREAATTGVDIN